MTTQRTIHAEPPPRHSPSEFTSFRGYLKACSDAQVQGCFDKETAANRHEFAQLALDEAITRGISIDRGVGRY